MIALSDAKRDLANARKLERLLGKPDLADAKPDAWYCYGGG